MIVVFCTITYDYDWWKQCVDIQITMNLIYYNASNELSYNIVFMLLHSTICLCLPVAHIIYMTSANMYIHMKFVMANII